MKQPTKPHIVMRAFFIVCCLFLPKTVFAQNVRIEMESIGGVFQVPCEVNGLKLKFVFDTGASYVSLSMTTANFMIEQGYLSENDIYNEIRMIQADGSSLKAYKVKLKTINIGGFLLTNVEGVISTSQNAPLLLGQSALQKLGKVTFKDNYLIIEREKEVNYTGIEKDITFNGLHQGDDYDDCENVLRKKYGDNKISYYITNNNIETIEVENDYFILKKFDTISLLFDNHKLAAVEITKYIPVKELNKALVFRDEIFSFLKKKYIATKRLRNKESGFDYYLLGFTNKKDNNLYPIMIDMDEMNLLRRYDDGESTMSNVYEIKIVYWYSDYKRLMDETYLKEEY